ncbi:MAG: restriction endonuclease subunit S [Nitrospirae bacterium]|nr:restriction endonuclease subunit S [Nitrospirota bacterium]
MVQQGLSLQKVRQTPIPILDVEFQESIRSVVVNAYNAIKDSENYFENAQAILLSELGLLAWQPKHRLSFVKNYSDTEQAGRIDAEHFQPKYDELIEIIKLTTQCKQIREIAKFNARGLQPQYNPEGQIKVVNSQHILDDHLDYDNFERTDDQSWDSQKKARIFQNDILIYTTGANIGRTNVYLIKDKCIASNHVNILRLEKENQIYVGFVMNSIIGRLQTQKHKSGAAQAELYPSDIEKFIVPFAKEETQNRITELLMSSFEKKIQSKAMLDIAKRAVEIAIEQNEDSALKWIGEQTKETGRH